MKYPSVRDEKKEKISWNFVHAIRNMSIVELTFSYVNFRAFHLRFIASVARPSNGLQFQRANNLLVFQTNK